MSDYDEARRMVRGHSALLARLSSPDHADRKSAEAALKHLEDSDPLYHVFALALISTAQEGIENPLRVRQIAARLLRRNLVEQVRGTGQRGRSSKTRMSTEVKEKLVNILLSSLSESEAEIRNSNAYVVAAIIKQDWRATWEKVLPVLTTMMNKTDNDEVLSSLKVVAAVFSGTFYDEEFIKRSYSLLPSIAQVIFSVQTTDNCQVHAIKSLPLYIKLMTRVGGSVFDDDVRLNFRCCKLNDMI